MDCSISIQFPDVKSATIACSTIMVGVKGNGRSASVTRDAKLDIQLRGATLRDIRGEAHAVMQQVDLVLSTLAAFDA